MSASAAESAENAVLGARTRDLLRALSEFTAMVAVDAPTSLLEAQIDDLDQILREIDTLAGSQLYESDIFGMMTGDLSKPMRLYEILARRSQGK